MATFIYPRFGSELRHSFVRREIESLQALGHTVQEVDLKQSKYIGASSIRLPAGTIWRQHRSWREVDSLSALGKDIVMSIAAPHLAEAIRGYPDAYVIVHFSGPVAYAAMLACMSEGRPYHLILHAYDIFSVKRSPHFLDIVREARSVACVNREGQDRIAAETGRRPELHRMEVRIAESQRHPAERTIDLLFVGGLVAKKGLRELIEGIAFAAQVGRVVVAGEGHERQRLERLSRRLGLDHLVDFVGAVSNEAALNLMRQSVVFATLCRTDDAGDRDGRPVALLEALASGCRVVTTRQGGLDDLCAGLPVVTLDDIRGRSVGAALDREVLLGKRCPGSSPGLETLMRLHGPQAGARSLLAITGASR